MRLTDALRPFKIEEGGLLVGDCHGFSIDDKVVLLAKEPEARICGASFNQIYYVSDSDFTSDELRLTTEIGDPAIVISDAGDQDFWLAKPLDITSYVIDSDICAISTPSRVQIATFAAIVDDEENGLFSLELDQTVTVNLSVGTYAFDVSLTQPSGKRFYAVEGQISVVNTKSR